MSDIKTNKMLVSVVLDKSGSMSSTRSGTISGYNEYINGIRKDTASEYNVTLIQFDSHGAAFGPELTISYIDKPLADVPILTEADYEPRGGTPLYDAIGECIRRVDAKDRAVTMVIITDGQNNTSKEFTAESVKALIKEKEALGWTFVFIGADIDSYAVGGSMSFTSGNISNYTKGNEQNLYSAMAQSTMTRSAMNMSVGVNTASRLAFFDDTQKASMGDQTASVITTVDSLNLGGQHSTAMPNFRPSKPIDTGRDPKTPVDGKAGRTKPREWAETVSK